MKQLLKFIFALMLSLFICSSMSTQLLDVGADIDVDEGKAYLISIGIPVNMVNDMDSAKIDELYEKYKDQPVICNGAKTEIVSIPNGLELFRGAIPESMLKFDIYTFLFEHQDFSDSNNPIIGDIEVWVDYTWIVGPIVHNTDALTIHWESDQLMLEDNETYTQEVPFGSTFVASSKIWNFDYPYGQSYGRITRPAQAAIGGVGWYYQVPIDHNDTITKRGGSARVILRPKSPDKEFSSQFTVNYVHDKNPLPFGLGFSISAGIISINTGVMTDSAGTSMIIKSNNR